MRNIFVKLVPVTNNRLNIMDAKMVSSGHYLNPPPVNPVRYQRNFITNAVCELRFPTLLELETRAPKDFQAKIRKLYPFYENQFIEPIGAPEGASYEQRYLFRSKDKNWTVSVSSSTISIETSHYSEFDEFFGRLSSLLESAREMIDSDFFTRVGLRYINSIPVSDESPDGWINSDLILPLTSGIFGAVQSSATIIQGNLKDGQYSMRHGLKSNNIEVEKGDLLQYALDFDYYKENVEFTEVLQLVKAFNETNFAFFSWCLGKKAKLILGEGKPK